MFEIKNFTGITADMIRQMKSTQTSVTDFNVGSVARTLVEAPAIEIDEFYQRVLIGLIESIPIAVYNAFGFDKLPALSAGGTVRISTETLVVDPVVIPAGTRIARTGTRIRYATLTEATIASGTDQVDVMVVAEYGGLDGNAPAASLTSFVDALPQSASVTNLEAVTGGKEEESPDERKSRFIEYIGSLSRGTVYALTNAARNSVVLDANGIVVEYVSRVGIGEGAGQVNLYIYGQGGAPSEDLLTTTQRTIDGWYDRATNSWVHGYRPVGVEVVVLPMIQNTVDIGLTIKMFDGFDGGQSVIDEIRTSIELLLLSIYPSQTLLIDEVNNAALSVLGVERSVSSNNANILCAPNNILVLGDLTIEFESA